MRTKLDKTMLAMQVDKAKKEDVEGASSATKENRSDKISDDYNYDRVIEGSLEGNICCNGRDSCCGAMHNTFEARDFRLIWSNAEDACYLC